MDKANFLNNSVFVLITFIAVVVVAGFVISFTAGGTPSSFLNAVPTNSAYHIGSALPQGHSDDGSGIDADKLDGLHKSEIESTITTNVTQDIVNNYITQAKPECNWEGPATIIHATSSTVADGYYICCNKLSSADQYGKVTGMAIYKLGPFNSEPVKPCPFRITLTVNTNPASIDTTTGSTGTGWPYLSGSSISFSAPENKFTSSATSYLFNGWTKTGTCSYVPDPTSWTKRSQCPWNWNTGLNDCVSPSPTATVAADSSCTITANYQTINTVAATITSSPTGLSNLSDSAAVSFTGAGNYVPKIVLDESKAATATTNPFTSFDGQSFNASVSAALTYKMTGSEKQVYDLKKWTATPTGCATNAPTSSWGASYPLWRPPIAFDTILKSGCTLTAEYDQIPTIHLSMDSIPSSIKQTDPTKFKIDGSSIFPADKIARLNSSSIPEVYNVGINAPYLASGNYYFCGWKTEGTCSYSDVGTSNSALTNIFLPSGTKTNQVCTIKARYKTAAQPSCPNA